MVEAGGTVPVATRPAEELRLLLRSLENNLERDEALDLGVDALLGVDDFPLRGLGVMCVVGVGVGGPEGTTGEAGTRGGKLTCWWAAAGAPESAASVGVVVAVGCSGVAGVGSTGAVGWSVSEMSIISSC